MGLQSVLLAKRYPNTRIDAYDIDSESIAMAREVAKQLRLDNLYFIEQDLLQLSNISDYDFIFCIDVLEHVKEDEELIKVFSKALKKDGVLYLATPMRDTSSDIYIGSGFNMIRKDMSAQAIVRKSLNLCYPRMGSPSTRLEIPGA